MPISRTLKFAISTSSFIADIASTRIYMGVHYLSDVIAGLTFGYIIGTLCMFGVEKAKKIIDEKY